LLERRLDNVVHRLGFGLSRAQARQLVNHGHITVNGRGVNVPSYEVRPGDIIRVKNQVKSLGCVRQALGEGGRDVPDYLTVDSEGVPEGIVGRLPGPDDISIPVQTQLIVEMCSR
ncbi:MAG: 30S ribosomal protein S4, partial [Aeoliella sp.]